jgi:hypothetical protein
VCYLSLKSVVCLRGRRSPRSTIPIVESSLNAPKNVGIHEFGIHEFGIHEFGIHEFGIQLLSKQNQVTTLAPSNPSAL